MTQNLLQSLSPPQFKLLRQIRKSAQKFRRPAYLVGGCVRDLLLGKKSLDWDVATEGDPRLLVEDCARRWRRPFHQHAAFGTYTLTLRTLRMDFATSRKETYPHPAALPRVWPASIALDLFRRDFSINSMALKLWPEPFGELLDPYGGRRDLQATVLRVLHPGSFADDPTRIFRAARFAARFRLRLDSETKEWMQQALRERLPDHLSEERLSHELWKLLEEKEPLPALTLLKKWGALTFFHPHLRLAPKIFKPSDPMTRLGLFLLELPSPQAQELLGRLKLPREKSRILQTALEVWAQKQSPLHPLPTTASKILAEKLGAKKLSALKPILLTGKDLQAQGIPAGKNYKTLLKKLGKAQWRGKLRTRPQAFKLLKSLLSL